MRVCIYIHAYMPPFSPFTLSLFFLFCWPTDAVMVFQSRRQAPQADELLLPLFSRRLSLSLSSSFSLVYSSWVQHIRERNRAVPIAGWASLSLSLRIESNRIESSRQLFIRGKSRNWRYYCAPILFPFSLPFGAAFPNTDYICVLSGKNSTHQIGVCV